MNNEDFTGGFIGETEDVTYTQTLEHFTRTKLLYTSLFL